jgi:hypothetical protein
VAAPDQRTPGRRPLPVAADTRRGGVRGGHQPSGRHRQAAAVPEPPRTLPQSAGGGMPCGGHPGLDSPPASRLCRRRRHRRRRPVSTAVAGGAWMDGRPPAPGCPRPAQGAAVVSAADSGRPDGWPQSPDIQQTLQCPVPRTPQGSGQVGVASRHRRSGRAWTADAACGHRQAAGVRRCPHRRPRQGRADTTARPRWTASSSTVHRRANVRPGTEPRGKHWPAPPWPDRQIRRSLRPSACCSGGSVRSEQ